MSTERKYDDEFKRQAVKLAAQAANKHIKSLKKKKNRELEELNEFF